MVFFVGYIQYAFVRSAVIDCALKTVLTIKIYNFTFALEFAIDKIARAIHSLLI